MKTPDPLRAALARVTAEVAAVRRAAEEFAAACAAQQRVWRAASDLAAQIAEKGRTDG